MWVRQSALRSAHRRIFRPSRSMLGTTMERRAGVAVPGARGFAGAGMEEKKRAVLQDALQHVPEQGWSTEAIAQVLPDHGLSSASHGLFRHGGYDLVAFVMDQVRWSNTTYDIHTHNAMCHAWRNALHI